MQSSLSFIHVNTLKQNCSAFGSFFFSSTAGEITFLIGRRQYNFVHDNRVRFIVSPDTSFNYVAYKVIYFTNAMEGTSPNEHSYQERLL